MEFLVKFGIVFCGWVIRILYIFWINLPHQVLGITKGWHGYLKTTSHLGVSRNTAEEHYGSARSEVTLPLGGPRLSFICSFF